MLSSYLSASSTSWITFAACLTSLVVVASIGAPIFFMRFVRNNFGHGSVKNGVSATATITRVWDTGTTINDDPVAGLDLLVSPPSGPPFPAQAKQIVSRLQVGYYQPGQTVTVSYDPANMKKMHITGVGNAAGVQTGAPAYQAAAVMADAQAMPAAVPTALEQQLLQINAANEVLRATGEPAQAQVLNYADWNVQVNGNNSVATLQLQVNPTGKPSFPAQATAVITATSVPKFQPGCTIWVKYNPNNPAQVTIDHS